MGCGLYYPFFLALIGGVLLLPFCRNYKKVVSLGMGPVLRGPRNLWNVVCLEWLLCLKAGEPVPLLENVERNNSWEAPV